MPPKVTGLVQLLAQFEPRSATTGLKKKKKTPDKENEEHQRLLNKQEWPLSARHCHAYNVK